MNLVFCYNVSMITEKIIVFGDLHQNWQAAKVTLDYARREDINTAINLGDEGPRGSWGTTRKDDLNQLFRELKLFRDESSRRRLVCVLGNDTYGIPKELFVNYAGVDPQTGEGISTTYREDNILAGHAGEWILEDYKGLVENYDGDKPLVIFHGNSHSMGVLPEYRWIKEQDFVYWLEEGKQRFKLEPQKVYWVNPGSGIAIVSQRPDGGHLVNGVANFAIYNPTLQEVLLKSIRFDPDEIIPS